MNQETIERKIAEFNRLYSDNVEPAEPDQRSGGANRAKLCVAESLDPETESESWSESWSDIEAEMLVNSP